MQELRDGKLLRQRPFDRRRRRSRPRASSVAELTSATVPAVGSDDHVAGEGPEAIVYMDLACPACAAMWPRIRELPLRLCFRHFPMASKHPRSPALHAAAEAAGAQGAFWEMADSLYAERGRVDDPHLWERAERFGLDRERFQAERRSDSVAERVHRDFQAASAPASRARPPPSRAARCWRVRSRRRWGRWRASGACACTPASWPSRETRRLRVRSSLLVAAASW